MRRNAERGDRIPVPPQTLPDDAPLASVSRVVAVAADGFAVAWDAVPGEWAGLEVTPHRSVAFTPPGGPSCSPAYQLRVRAHGDGVAYEAA